MPGSQSLIGGGDMPGLTLKAWAICSGGGGLFSGMNVSSVTAGSNGQFTLNLSQPLVNVGRCIVVLKPETPSPNVGFNRTGTNAAPMVTVLVSGSPSWLSGNLWIGIYE